jgi:hypothetical protein
MIMLKIHNKYEEYRESLRPVVHGPIVCLEAEYTWK